MPGALADLTIVEFAAIGPAPFCGMMLADHGARVIRIDRPGTRADPADPLARGKHSIIIDLKTPTGLAAARALCAHADGVIEGLRPGVMERLGLDPAALLAANPALVIGRMTGWGQTGPLAAAAGHDINYIAVAGVLHGIGVDGHKPVPPVNYLGDFGGGGMMLAFGMVAALLHAHRTGAGQIIDCAMTDGAALLSAMTWGFRAGGQWQDRAGVNLLDGGAHFYDSYVCADGKYVAVGAIEPQFYRLLREKLGLATDPDFDAQFNPAVWPALKAKLAAVFAAQPRAHWCALLEGCDACFAPILAMDEAPGHPHNAARATFIAVDGVVQPAPAPRYSLTPAPPPMAPPSPGRDSDAILAAAGYDPVAIAALRADGVIG